MPEVEIGKVSDFFARPVVAGIELTAPLKVGDRIHIVGHTTDIELAVESMQIDNVDVKEAKAGNKGFDAAMDAIEMANLLKSIG